MLRDGLKLRRPNLIFRPNKLFIVLFQLRRTTKKSTVVNIARATIIRSDFFTFCDQSCYELRRDLDQNPTVRSLQVLERRVPEVDGAGRLVIIRGGEGGEGGGGEGGAEGEAVEGEDEVGLAGEELVVDAEGRDGVADEEGVGVAYHLVRELEHDLPGDVPLSREDSCAAVEEY